MVGISIISSNDRRSGRLRRKCCINVDDISGSINGGINGGINGSIDGHRVENSFDGCIDFHCVRG